MLSPSASSISSFDLELSYGKNITDVLSDNEYTEIMPVRHYDSAKSTCHGSFTSKEDGTYLLLFDNTYSVNTPKKLMFSVAIVESSVPQTKSHTIYEGFIYKKGNKKNQGYAKRWLKIDESGNLQYYKSQSGRCRQSVILSQSAVRINHGSIFIQANRNRSIID